MDSYNIGELRALLDGRGPDGPSTEVLPPQQPPSPSEAPTPSRAPASYQQPNAREPGQSARALPDVMVYVQREGLHPDDVIRAIKLLGREVPASLPNGSYRLDAQLLTAAAELNKDRLAAERAAFDRKVAEIAERKRLAREEAEQRAQLEAATTTEGAPTEAVLDEVFNQGYDAATQEVKLAAERKKKLRHKRIGYTALGLGLTFTIGPAFGGVGVAALQGHRSPEGLFSGAVRPYTKALSFFSGPSTAKKQPASIPVAPVTTETSPTTLPTLETTPTESPTTKSHKPFKTIAAEPVPTAVTVTVTTTASETTKESSTQPPTGTPTPPKPITPTPSETATATATKTATATQTTKPTATASPTTSIKTPTPTTTTTARR